MKSALILGISLIAFSLSARAQIQSGKVYYEETIKMDVKLEGEAAEYANLFPKEHKEKQVLYFTADEALYQHVPRPEKKEEEQTLAGGGGPMLVTIGVSSSDDKIYTGIKEGTTVEQHSFLGRDFLVESALAASAWKLTGNQKTILNYPCQEAILIKDKDTIIAWFTPSIPVSAGPRGLSGLPGLILTLTKNSNLTIAATSVEPGPVEEGLITRPKKGKKVSQEEFKAIMDAKAKEMGATGSGGAQMIINIREH